MNCTIVMRFSVFSRAAVLVMAAGLLLSCRTKPVAVAIPADSEKAASYLAEGDLCFQGLHLHAWRKAEPLYQQAYELNPSAEARERLALTRFLRFTREIDEDIPLPGLDGILQEMCAGASAERETPLCELAGRYREGLTATGSVPRPAPQLWDPGNSALDAYLHSLWLRAFSLEDPAESRQERFARFSESPLIAYLRFETEGARRATDLEEAFPEFAELFVLHAEDLFQKRRFSAAKTYFQKAIDLIPDYTRAINGLANIQLFVLEDPEKARDYYEAALGYDPANTAALFGKGMVLHRLGRYADSSAALDDMLAGDISRKGRAGKTSIRYYLGQGRYLKAYNHYLLGNPAEARALVETARRFIPNAEELNYLSGVLYFEDKRLEDARDDFVKVLQHSNPNCNASYYLGRIYKERRDLDEKRPWVIPALPSGEAYDKLRKLLEQLPEGREPREKRSVDYFLGACSCLEQSLKNLSGQIAAIPSMDLTEAEKLALRGRLQKRLLDSRIAAVSMINAMLQLAADEPVQGREVYLDLMKEVLSRIIHETGGSKHLGTRTNTKSTRLNP